MATETKPKAKESRASDFHIQQLKDGLAVFEKKLANIDSVPADKREEVRTRTQRYIADRKKQIEKASK